jgi:glycosyltransferase involved in cell wall biosynthesis
MMLSELLDALDPNRVEAHVMMSTRGALAELLRPHAANLLLEPRLRHIVLDAGGAKALAANGRAYAQVVAKLTERLRRGRFDLLHAVATPAFKYGVAARVAGVPALATLYEVLDERLIHSGSRALLTLNLNLFYRRILVPSQAARNSAVGAGISSARTSVFPNGIDMARFQPRPCVRQAVRQELGLPDTAMVLGAVGRLIPLKGQDTVIEAVAPILRERHDVRLVVVGGARTAVESQWDGKLRSLSHALGVERQVVFTGWRTDVDRVLQALNVLVHAPRLPDASPVVLIEAMASGLPCVAVDIGGAAEIVAHESTGLLTPADPALLRQAIIRMINSDERTAMGARGRARVLPLFDKFHRAEELTSLYHELLHATRPRGLAG